MMQIIHLDGTIEPISYRSALLIIIGHRNSMRNILNPPRKLLLSLINNKDWAYNLIHVLNIPDDILIRFISQYPDLINLTQSTRWKNNRGEAIQQKHCSEHVILEAIKINPYIIKHFRHEQITDEMKEIAYYNVNQDERILMVEQQYLHNMEGFFDSRPELLLAHEMGVLEN